MKNRILSFVLLSFFSFSALAHAPRVRKMKSSEKKLSDEFSHFHGNDELTTLLLYLLLGYMTSQELFAEFLSNLKGGTSGSSKEYCDDKDVSDSEGSVKVNFDCEDDIEYSCYAGVIDGTYELTVPDAVSGLSCKISVESLSVNEDSSDLDSEGVATEDEVVLEDGETIEIDVDEDAVD